MSNTTSVPCPVFHYPEFKAQPDWFRAAVFALANGLSEYGDGALSDAGLRSECGLGPERWAQLVETLLTWGWIRRDGAQRLTRAGMLLPPSQDALRMRNRRQMGNEAQDLERTETEQTPNRAPVGKAFHGQANRTHYERSANVLAPASDSGSDSDIRSDTDFESRSDARSESESDLSLMNLNQILTRARERSAEHEANALPEVLVVHASFRRLYEEGVGVAVLCEAAQRMNASRVELWKEKYLRNVVKQIAAEGLNGAARDPCQAIGEQQQTGGGLSGSPGNTGTKEIRNSIQT